MTKMLIGCVCVTSLLSIPADAAGPTWRVQGKGEFVTVTSVDTTECIFAFVLALRQQTRNSDRATTDSLFVAYDIWDTCTPAEDGSSSTLLARGWGFVLDPHRSLLQVTKAAATLNFTVPDTNFETQGLTGAVSLRLARTSSPRTFSGQTSWEPEEGSLRYLSIGTFTEVTAAVSGTFMGIPLDGSVGTIGLNQQRTITFTMK